MKYILTCLFLFFCLVFSVSAQKHRISVSDFLVQSENPSYKYLGKGVSRLIESELKISGRIVLIERDQVKKIFEEQQFSLSDFADAEKQIKVGMMLAAEYLVMGEIIDMIEVLLINVRVVKVETGEIDFEVILKEKLASYDYIGAYFARSILENLDVPVEQAIAKKLESKTEKKEEAIVKLSEGLAAYDENDTARAAQALNEARSLDPENSVAREYLEKLVQNTAKFKTLTEQYYPLQNPAYLGIIRYDNIYLSTSYNTLFAPDWRDIASYPGLKMREWDTRVSAGFNLPLGAAWGLGMSYLFYYTSDQMYDPVMQPTDSCERYGNGAILSLGFAPASFFSIGLSLSIYGQIIRGFAESAGGGGTTEYNEFYFPFAVSGGFLLRSPDNDLIFDLFGGYSAEKSLYFNPATFPNKRSEMEDRLAPIFVEATFTAAFNSKRTFIILKELNDYRYDIGAYYGRLIPAVEHWFFDWLAVRAGAEAALIKAGNDIKFGIGGTGGLSLRIIDWGLDLDLTLTYRKRPSRFIDGEVLDEFIPIITITKNKTLLSR